MFEDPVREVSEDEADKLGLRYYDSEVHKAAFSLPQFMKQVRFMQYY